jgi:hypothetical protein
MLSTKSSFREYSLETRVRPPAQPLAELPGYDFAASIGCKNIILYSYSPLTGQVHARFNRKSHRLRVALSHQQLCMAPRGLQSKPVSGSVDNGQFAVLVNQ